MAEGGRRELGLRQAGRAKHGRNRRRRFSRRPIKLLIIYENYVFLLTYTQTCVIFLKKDVLFMRISAKGRYGLAALVYMAQNGKHETSVTVISISENLKISKIYLEQIFSLLRRGGIATSTKGAQGGYRLAKPPKDITVFDCLSAIDTALFEKTEATVNDADVSIEKAMQEGVFNMLDFSVKTTLSSITLKDLALQATKYKDGEGYMFYI